MRTPFPLQILDDFMGAIVSDATTCAADLARSRQLSAHTIPHIRGRNIDAVLGMGGAAKAPPTGFDMVQGNSRIEFQDASVAAPPVLSTSDVQLYVQEVGCHARLRTTQSLQRTAAEALKYPTFFSLFTRPSTTRIFVSSLCLLRDF
jgi:hypothetical protein